MLLISDPSITDFRDLASDIFARNAALSINFEIDLNNLASVASGNNIISSSGDNYLLSVFLSDADLRSGSGSSTVVGSSLAISSDLTVGLIAQAASPTTMVGSVDLTLPTVSCNTYEYVCAQLSNGAAAGFDDADTSDSSNIFCIDITTRMYCSPGTYIHINYG